MKRAALFALCLMASPAFAQSEGKPDDTLFGIIYHVGQPDHPKKFTGRVLITSTELQFLKLHMKGMRGKEVYEPEFALPLSEITAAVGSTDKDYHPGAAALLGAWAGTPNHVELVAVTTETATTTNVIIFEVAKRFSSIVATKIAFAAKKARERAGLQ